MSSERTTRRGRLYRSKELKCTLALPSPFFFTLPLLSSSPHARMLIAALQDQTRFLDTLPWTQQSLTARFKRVSAEAAATLRSRGLSVVT